MVTKSKNDRAMFWSLVAIFIALLSIGYCSSHIIDLVSDGVERTTRIIAYFTRLVKGSM
ncbi:hypothetical protein AB1K83_14435 [Sporosarcina sp. 179-K 3D1 HS]|uniref:hypothetical protein n=1 Tax=Sporosarcina sp. 179-K 3D1 HS TaxID=3232169 RepID=UPI0039A2446D